MKCSIFIVKFYRLINTLFDKCFSLHTKLSVKALETKFIFMHHVPMDKFLELRILLHVLVVNLLKFLIS